MNRTLLAASLFCVTGTAGLLTARQPAGPAIDPKIDAIFARWTTQTPGCAVGVAKGGRHVLEQAYGMADLERNVPNTAGTIFEAGPSRRSSRRRPCCCWRRTASSPSMILSGSTCRSCPTTVPR